jgi:hypothetical protein
MEGKMMNCNSHKLHSLRRFDEELPTALQNEMKEKLNNKQERRHINR